MSDDDALREPFRAWLASRWSDVADLEIGVFQQPKSGFSAKTIFVPLSYRRAGRAIEDKIVLRLENPEPAIYPQQAPGLDVEIEIQYRSMEALARTGKVPLADLIGYEADASILGQPFFAMAFVGGNVMTEDPPYSQSGFFVDATPDERREDHPPRHRHDGHLPYDRLAEGGLRVARRARRGSHGRASDRHLGGLHAPRARRSRASRLRPRRRVAASKPPA
ncbi:MAG: hypothetical protein R3E53_08765 [Myxococcota bacterium]